MNALGVNVPAIYTGESAYYVLTVSDEISEVFDITASRDGRPIITGHDFRGPQCGTDPRDDTAERFAAMFGAFLGAAIEEETANQDGLDNWTIRDQDADLSTLVDACDMFGEQGEQS